MPLVYLDNKFERNVQHKLNVLCMIGITVVKLAFI